MVQMLADIASRLWLALKAFSDPRFLPRWEGDLLLRESPRDPVRRLEVRSQRVLRTHLAPKPRHLLQDPARWEGDLLLSR